MYTLADPRPTLDRVQDKSLVGIRDVHAGIALRVLHAREGAHLRNGELGLK